VRYSQRIQKMKNIRRIVSSSAWTIAAAAFLIAITAIGKGAENSPHRPLRVALYPFVPQKAELLLKVLQDYRQSHPEIDLQLIDLDGDYYRDALRKALTAGSQNAPVDVAEVDTIFLQDFVDDHLIEELPQGEIGNVGTYVPLAASAVVLNGRLYGIPHWICGDFLFFRKDDAAALQLSQSKTLKDLETIFGHVSSEADALMADLSGKSTLGEMYLHALVDEYHTPEEALKHIQPTDDSAVESIKRLLVLCPGSLDHAIKFHIFGQFYARQFTHRKARAIISYSEGLHDVLDEYLHGVGLHEPAVGQIYKFDSSISDFVPFSADDVQVVAAPMADTGEKMLGWVDAMCIRKDLAPQVSTDALDFIRFFSSEEFNRQLLIPAIDDAPRYLLPARLSLFTDQKILVMAPLYPRLLEIMKDAVSVTGPHLNENLRKAGGEIDKKLSAPQ
jgi:thiamine pyridinylase